MESELPVLLTPKLLIDQRKKLIRHPNITLFNRSQNPRNISNTIILPSKPKTMNYKIPPDPIRQIQRTTFTLTRPELGRRSEVEGEESI